MHRSLPSIAGIVMTVFHMLQVLSVTAEYPQTEIAQLRGGTTREYQYHRQEQELVPPRALQQVSGVGTVVSWRLINATTGNQGQVLIDPLLNGTVIDLATYPRNQQFSVDVITSTTNGPVGSVRFQYDSRANYNTESEAPYALCRNNGLQFAPCPKLVLVSTVSVGATPYSLSSGAGIKGIQNQLSFHIVNTTTTLAPVSTPTKVPTKAPTNAPTNVPANAPTKTPAKGPTKTPTKSPTKVPTKSPTKVPTKAPTKVPTKPPTKVPTKAPTKIPTKLPTQNPVTTPTATPVATAPAQWIEVNLNAPLNARHEACFLMVGRKAYLLAGRGIKPVNIYDPVTRTWTNGTAPPIQIHHTQCVAVNNDSIWIVSAWTGGYPMERNTDKIYIYNTTTDRWSTKPGLPEHRRRGGAAAVLVGDKIYVSHGNRGGHETGNFSTSLNWLDYYDITEDRWYTNLTDAPHPRDHVGGGLVNGRICVAGGRDGGDIDFFAKVTLPTDCYDPATGTWSVEADIPFGRAGSSYGTTCDGKLMVAGGEGGTKAAAKGAWTNVDVFDGMSWTSIDSLNIPRHGSGLAVDCICQQIHIASGARTQGGRYEITSVETLFPNGVDVPCPA